jgi:cyclic peptide transporter
MKTVKRILAAILVICITISLSNVATANKEDKIKEISKYIEENFKELKTPGLSVGIIDNNEINFLNYGYSDVENGVKVTEKTNFEVASLTKAFTAIGITELESKGLLSMNDTVTKYFPGFNVKYRGKNYDITIKQLLHHTSGISKETIKLFREDKSSDALISIVDKINGIELHYVPGSQFEYATINYDILGAIIEKISGESYEAFIRKQVLQPLEMNDSYIGVINNDKNLSKGYKINYLKPRLYEAPIFRGNYPAGYLVSNTKDMIKWLTFQMGQSDIDLSLLVNKIHEPDKSVQPSNNSFYSSGWFNVLNRYEEIKHDGSNPNFSAYISFSKKNHIGIIMLANSNSENFYELANNLTNYLYSGQLEGMTREASGIDTTFSIVNIICILLSIGLIAFWGFILYEYKNGKRSFGFEQGSVRKLIIYFTCSIPVLFGIYLIPKAVSGTDWYTAIVWLPQSFIHSIIASTSIICLSYITYLLLLLFPKKDIYYKEAPEIITLSVLAGISNAIIIFLITCTLNGRDNLKYIIYYFLVSFYIYIVGRRTLEMKLAHLSQLIIKSIRETIFEKLFGTNFEKFEKMESGKLTATITADINQIGDLAGLVVILITSVITIVSSFIILAMISAMSTLAALLIIAIVAFIYAYFSSKARDYFETARETQNIFIAKIEALITGFKDISLHKQKKNEYSQEMKEINQKYMENNIKAFRMFIDAFMFGESLFIIVLGSIAFGFSFIFKSISDQELIAFVTILLYILGPINSILNSVPRIMQIRVAIDRVKQLMNQLPDLNVDEKREKISNETIEEFSVENLTYEYENNDGTKGFKVGPIDFNLKKGEILFIIGGNGSGKSTLLKQLTGLYRSNAGHIKINGKAIDDSYLGEYSSTVFADSYLFKRIYNANLNDQEEMIKEHLNMFDLYDKVQIVDGQFTTTLLSTGQRKRLHLLRCYLENKSIFIFDEIAADQDPQFRKYFYKTLVPIMKKKGKIVIAVTHDDHYFEVADKILKLDMGKIDDISISYSESDVITA